MLFLFSGAKTNKNEQKLASARKCGSLFMRQTSHLQGFLCDRVLPASRFVVGLVRPSRRALLARDPIGLEVTRQDLLHAIFVHLLSLLRYRVGMKLWIHWHWSDVRVYAQVNTIRQVVFAAHRDDELPHASIVFDYMSANLGYRCAA